VHWSVGCLLGGWFGLGGGLVGWLAGRLVVGFIGCLVGVFVGWSVSGLVG